MKKILPLTIAAIAIVGASCGSSADTAPPAPIPVESDGGIGDSADPLPEPTLEETVESSDLVGGISAEGQLFLDLLIESGYGYLIVDPSFADGVVETSCAMAPNMDSLLTAAVILENIAEQSRVTTEEYSYVFVSALQAGCPDEALRIQALFSGTSA